MLQNLGAGTEKTYQNGKYINYTESSAYTEGIGTIGQECAIPPQAFSGFTVEDTALINGDLRARTFRNKEFQLAYELAKTEAGLLERADDDSDKRRAFIQLSDKAAAAMAGYFASLGRGAGSSV